MNTADWTGRAVYAAVIFGLNLLHGEYFGNPENSITGVAIYVCTSAVCNLVAVILAAHLLRGKASYDMQRLAYCAIVANFLSFILYSAKISPIVLNITIMVISYVQLARLIWPSNGDPSYHHRRFGFFRLAALQGKNIHLEATKS